MKAGMVTVMVSVVLLALPGVLCAQESNPLSVVNAWVVALNAGDIDGALSYVADDAVVTIVPPAPGTSGVFTGKEEIRGWYEPIVGEHGVTTLSDYKTHAFGEAYGVRIKELGLLARSVFVVDADGDIQYIQIVKETTDEPNYDEVLAAVKALSE